MEGLMPAGPAGFRLPATRVVADLVVGEEERSEELSPQMLVLLPDERRFYVVYRAVFDIGFSPGEERGARLRTMEGWFPAQRSEA